MEYPRLIVNYKREVSPSLERVDSCFVQIAPNLAMEPLPSTIDELKLRQAETTRLLDMLENGQESDVPHPVVLKLGPRRFALLKEGAALQAHRNRRLCTVAKMLVYSCKDHEIPFITGFEEGAPS